MYATAMGTQARAVPTTSLEKLSSEPTTAVHETALFHKLGRRLGGVYFGGVQCLVLMSIYVLSEVHLFLIVYMKHYRWA
jgi:hypothetical protein